MPVLHFRSNAVNRLPTAFANRFTSCATACSVVEIGVAFSGLLLFFGRAAALPLYGLVLAGVWIGSSLEVGPGFKPMLMRVGLPSLIGLYLFFGGVRDRLRRGGAGA